MMPKYVFKHDPNIGSLYFPFYQYFLGRWNNPDIPEYDLESDELIYRDLAGNEVRREKFNEVKKGGDHHTNPKNHAIPKNHNEIKNCTLSPLWTHGDHARIGDFSMARPQEAKSSLFGGQRSRYVKMQVG